MADIKTIDDENFAGKKVLVRVDFNAPVDADGNVTDDTRIRAALPTINKLVGDGARVILTSHRGRPAGEGFEESFSLGPIARRLQELLGRDIVLSRELIGPAAQEAVDALEDGDVLLLENIRFDKREKKNDPEFARALADLADAYVNDAFGTAHRAHASTAGVAAYLPSYAGYLMAVSYTHLLGMRFIYLDDAAAARVRNGNPLDGRAVELFERRSVDPAAELCACTAGVRPSCEPPQNGEVVALVADNRIVALYEYHVDKGRFAPRCVFPIGVSRGCSDL